MFEHSVRLLFPGVEVKAGEPVKVTPEAGQIIHVSQVILTLLPYC